MWEGRTPEPLAEGTFTMIVDCIRYFMVTLSMFGLFFVLVQILEGSRERNQSSKASNDRQNEQLPVHKALATLVRTVYGSPV